MEATVSTAQSRSSVVVGIDGSPAAIEAARWAVEEAADRDIPLRLVYVIDEKSSDMSIKLQYAETALRAATRAAEAVGKPVGIETSIIYGSVDEGLIEESKAAIMICAGSVGVGSVAWTLLGSTAATLAGSAHCPVAIIGRHDRPRRWQPAPIAVAVENSTDSDPAIELAMQEATLRHAPVLAVGVRSPELGDVPSDELDRRMDQWRDRYPGVVVDVVVARDGFWNLLAQTYDPVALAVGAGAVHHARCSVLVVPPAVDHRIAARIISMSSIVL
jgi:nucleotide-binding universal stress UspA family protein